MGDLFSTDLKLTRRSFNDEACDREVVDVIVAGSGDLQTVSGNDNLCQAIINRLLTRRGELGRLGHPEYGSRLHALVGEPNNARTRGLAEIYIRECLAQEPRIREIGRIVFAAVPAGGARNVVTATVTVKPGGTLTIPVRLGG